METAGAGRTTRIISSINVDVSEAASSMATTWIWAFSDQSSWGFKRTGSPVPSDRNESGTMVIYSGLVSALITKVRTESSTSVV